MKVGAVVAAVGVLVFEYRSCTEPAGQSTAEQQVALSPSDSLIRGQAYFASKKYIRKALEKADSLIFPDYREVEVSVSGKRFVVNTWVDEVSAVKFHRHYYQANMEKSDELTWQCRGLTVDGELVK